MAVHCNAGSTTCVCDERLITVQYSADYLSLMWATQFIALGHYIIAIIPVLVPHKSNVCTFIVVLMYKAGKKCIIQLHYTAR